MAKTPPFKLAIKNLQKQIKILEEGSQPPEIKTASVQFFTGVIDLIETGLPKAIDTVNPPTVNDVVGRVIASGRNKINMAAVFSDEEALATPPGDSDPQATKSPTAPTAPSDPVSTEPSVPAQQEAAAAAAGF